VVAGVVEVVVEVFVGVVVVLVVAAVVAVVGVVVVAAVVTAWHVRTARWLTVETPLLRSARSLLLTVDGMLASALTRDCAALRTALQLPAASAEET
jgi:hypothetical protein